MIYQAGAGSSASVFNLKRNQSCQQSRGIELANDRFQIAEATRHRVYRKDIAVTRLCQRHEAEIDDVAGQCGIILKHHSKKCLGNQHPDNREQRRKRHGDA
jgi:hypothetical protein